MIGAGVAGSFAALALATRLPCARIALLERSCWPREKVCGCCLNARAVRALDSLGILGALRRRGATPITRAEIRNAASGATLQIGAGLAIDRATLDDCIVRAGIERGAVFCPGTSAQVLRHEGPGATRTVRAQCDGETISIRARLVLVADGLGGASLSGISGFDRRPRPDSFIGLGAIITGTDGPPAGVVRMHVAPGGYVGLVRLQQDRLAVAAAMDPAFVRRAGSPTLAIGSVLRSCRVEIPSGLQNSHVRGTARLTHRRSRVAEPGILVLGDAASYVEPFTGEGMGWSMQSAWHAAELAAACVRGASSLDSVAHAWEHMHSTSGRTRERFCEMIRVCLRSRFLSPAAMWALRSAAVRRTLERRFAGGDPSPWGDLNGGPLPMPRAIA